MAEENDIGLTREVGSFSYRALMRARELIKPGAKLLDVANEVERFVKDNGFECAFPINLSINSEAAHYTPSFMDEKAFSDNDVVKVDFGTAKNGQLGDCALTVDLSGDRGALVDAAKAALDNAIGAVRAGAKAMDIGRVIEETVRPRGFRPIINLGGHGVEKHDLHTGIFIPNYDNHDDSELEEGMVIAIEPFVTDGKKDTVVESDICEIYGFLGPSGVRSPAARKIQDEIMAHYRSEPFAARWLSGVVETRFALYAAINELIRNGSLERYPMLTVQDTGVVAQAEAEVLVTKDGCEVLTR